ncbi:hypothetical protein C5G87_10585 [Paenibacillus peoriae]|uniref:hypothetical protein n=1 Tax=Paenibacillus peoriae TaxID=59893 RepID=UPI000CEB9C98|nr:hypothetical protein [Paenibacillus peoriae]PPQ49030.1 hypothetical protein C5G87_10585 [Paenibacillus peoriae]
MTSRDIILTAISVVLGGLLSYFVSALFYKRQKKESDTIERERTKRAHHEILDTLESYIINKEPIRVVQIKHLIESCEREYNISFRGFISPTTLLQDVSFRLQRSKHLNVQEKANYAQTVEELINVAREYKLEFEIFYQRYRVTHLISSIKKDLESENTSNLAKHLDEIEAVVQGMNLPSNNTVVKAPNIKLTMVLLIGLFVLTQALPHVFSVFIENEMKAYRYSYALISGATIGLIISNRLNTVFEKIFNAVIKRIEKRKGNIK